VTNKLEHWCLTNNSARTCFFGPISGFSAQKIHFATLSNGSTITPSFFNGGKYDFTEDTYTEHIEYWNSDSTATYIGRSFTFESKIKGDQWTISGPIKKTGESLPPWKVDEVYKRIN
jgi:hypothetical protein